MRTHNPLAACQRALALFSYLGQSLVIEIKNADQIGVVPPEIPNEE